MIEKKEFFGLNHYRYGEAYFGSCQGMRYRLAREPLENVVFVPPEKQSPAVLLATIWPEPWSYGVTPKEERESKEFPFSEEGLEQAVAWFNERHEAEAERWSAAAEQS